METMHTETQEYINGMAPGPLTREIPECMRNKYTLIQSIFDLTVTLLTAIGYLIQGIYRSLFRRTKKDLKGQIALITGGGGGLGSLIALRLARLGCVVVLWDINKQGLEDTVKLVKGIGGKCFGYVVDLAAREDIYRVADQVKREVGCVSLLVNNAGVVSGQLLLDTPDHLIQRTFDVNIIAHFWTVKAFIPDMIESNNGHIVTIASMAGHVGVPKLVDYCASKSAACGFHEALKVELESKGVDGVHTSLICPYFIRATGMFEEVQSRIVPQLNSNDVADRVVYAIRTNENVAVIPSYLRILLPFKWIVPWASVSEIIRSMVTDAMPGSPVPQADRKMQADVPKINGKVESRPMTLIPPARHDRHV
ncbi:unnamed protein product [Leptosia nina]|uniref:Uncharacterized protein n=1 Tax=Leptosia nina TaxID=320188 RepID=A0AAV1K4T0_9NEOP